MKTRLALPFLIAALSLTSACAPKHKGDEPSREELKNDTVIEVEDAVAPEQQIDIDMGKDTTGETVPDPNSPEGAGESDDGEDEGKLPKNAVQSAQTEDQDESQIVGSEEENGANEHVLTNDETAGISPNEIDEQSSEIVNVEATVEEMAAKRRGASKRKGAVRKKKRSKKSAPAVARSSITFGTATGSTAAPKSNESTRFAPASITKLVTTGMALERLGHDFSFHHKIAWRFAKGSTTTATNLTWLGEGDPTLGHPRFEADSAGMSTLKKFAAALKAKGIKSVQGAITLRPADGRMQGWFVANGVPDWEPFTCYGAPPRAFNIFRNCSGPKSGMRDPQTRAKQAFVAALKNQGISVNESTQPEVNPPVLSVTFNSASLPKLLYWMNKPSDNLIAESLFKAVARTGRGSNLQQNGQSLYKSSIISWMTQMGVGGLAGEMNFLDGSGLTPNNVVTPRGFVQMLKRYIPKNYFADLWQSLPIAGVDGTLARRANNPEIRGKVRAKTGTLTGSYQLAGYIPRLTADGKTVKELVPFAILTKAPGSDAGRRAAHMYQDQVLVELSRKVNGK